MGDSKLCLLLLLSTLALAFAQDEGHPDCLLAQRYKTLHKYEYQYEAESLNSINGASQLKNGPRASCKVEVEVPQTCSFIVRTTGCKLSEVVDTDAEGNPVFAPASNSDAFAAEMKKYPLKIVVEGEYDVKLYPEDGETTIILNFKRGIVSALAVPLLEEDKNKNMPTIHGKCRTYYTINAREDIATDISLNRDLSRCDHFEPIRDHSSPLALITGMHYPLAQMVRSSQTCNYKFDNEKKHMTSGSCTENHILVPFSHKGKYGVTNVGKQELTLVEVSTHNDRVFDHGGVVKALHMEAVEDKSAIQDKDAFLNLVRELVDLPETEGERRPHLFHTLVSTVRGMRTETLHAAVPEAASVSRVLTYQVLTQCGTPECSSAIMHILRTIDKHSPEVDAAVFALGFLSNPSALLINDMLEMAKYKPSKPIMYALSNVVKRFYKAEEKVIPEILSVAEFMTSQLGDCTGQQDQTFMTLRVVGNMAPAVVPASPALRAAVINCVKQPAASQEVQQAAIQVYRLIPVPNEVREVFMQVLLDSSKSVQERIAAYLILMKDPQPSELTQLSKVLSSKGDHQVKSFVISHISNILSSTESETQELRQKIQDALQGNEIDPTMDPINFSRHYKIGSLEGNMIFEDVGYLPKEVMLEMTLKAFGFEIDMMEIGMDGKGFEPTVEALFGEKGFFPDTAMKTMYFVSDKMPHAVNDILENIVPALKKNRMKRQTSQHLLKEIGQNFDKLVKQLQGQNFPEAMVYLRILGNELGYLGSQDIEEMILWLTMRLGNMYTMFPGNIIKSLMTNPDTTIFAHYIFMDNEFFLPTVTGVPLRIALSGTFTPGFKGGLQIDRGMTFSFMPSGGIEFITQIGSHIPEYVNSGLEMHTNIFHESGIKAKISMESNQVKLTIPAPTQPTKLIKMTNNLVAVTGSEVKTIPPLVMDKVDVSKCTSAFAGMNFCTALQYVDAFSHETAPYFPFTGDSKFAVELHPTGEVIEYTVTAAYELLNEGEEGRQKVDSLKFILRAEGAEPTEARLAMKYNRRKNIISADIQIPDYDVEAGFWLGIVDGNTKGQRTHSITLEFVNKNIPELSLFGRAKLRAMKEGMLQFQVQVPSIKAESTVTAYLKREKERELELESKIKIMDATSEQKINMKYDDSKIEVEVKSEMNTKTNSLPNGEFIEKYANEILDMQVGQTDMKVRHIFKKFVEAANNYMEKYGAEMLPYMKNFRLPDIPEISLPETLFLNTKAKAVYHFNNEHFTVIIPLPFGGKSTSDFNFPPALTTPSLSLPYFGLEIVSREIPIPDLALPTNCTLSIPLFGKAEFSTKMTSNLYDIEATLNAGKDVEEPPSYSAKFDLKGNSPIDILSVAVAGSGIVTMSDSIKAHLTSSLTHKFIEAKISIEEDGAITDKINLKSVSKLKATSPFGLNISLEHSGMAGINTEEFSGYSTIEGLVKVGPIYGKTISTQSFTVIPFRPEAKINSHVQFDSPILDAQNTITTTFGNDEFSFVSNTKAFEDVYTHTTELSFKDSKLRMKCDEKVLVLGMKIHNQAEASASSGEVIIKIETNGDHFDNRVYSLLIASLDKKGISVNCNANVKLLENEAVHKTILTINRDGLSTSGTTTLSGSLLLENTFDAVIDATRANLSISNKAEMNDIKVDHANTLSMTLSSLDFQSKAKASETGYVSYTHNINFNLKPYSASANVDNHLEFPAISFDSEALFQATPYKMDLTGNMKATYDEEEIKHTYQINYADLSANAKCSTTGKLFGTHMNHNTELEIIGLAAKFTNDARFSSQPIRFDHNVRWSIVPFDFNLNAIFNADGDVMVYGKHSGQLYSKLQLRAQPLAFASLHECRASTTQQLDNGFSLETSYDYKMDTLLSPQEQKTGLKFKTKMNEHALIQGIEVYNTAEKMGIELSGSILTNIINTASPDNQEFTISGFLKYDKSTDNFPLIENLPVFLESIKELVVYVAEALQDIINHEDVRARLEALPQQISGIVAEIDLEGKVNQLKHFFIDFTQSFNVTLEDIELFLNDLRMKAEEALNDLDFSTQRVADTISDAIYSSTFYENLSQEIEEVVKDIDDIKLVVVHWMDIIGEMIQQSDIGKLKGSSIQFLYDIEVQYNIKVKVQTIISYVREKINSFDVPDFVKEIKKFISFSHHLFISLIKDFVFHAPKEIFYRTTQYMIMLIDKLDIVGKINYVYAKLNVLLVQLEVNKNAQAVLEKAVDLIKQLKMEETINGMVQSVKEADILNKYMKIFQTIIDYLKANEIKDMIEHLNMHIETLVQELKSLNYNNLVNHINPIIAEYSSFLNEIIKTSEIPQKLEAARQFVNSVLSSIQDFVAHLREIKVVEIINFAKDICEKVVCDSLEKFAEYIKREIENVDFRKKLNFFLEIVQFFYTLPLAVTKEVLDNVFREIEKVLPDEKIIHEIKQIMDAFFKELRNYKLYTPSFTVPFTNLVVPSKMVNLNWHEYWKIPSEIDIPEFIILGRYTVTATTLSFKDINQKIVELIDLILKFKTETFDIDAVFGDLTLNFLPSLPEISLLEFTLPEVTFPIIPQLPVEELVKTLEIPEIKLPVIPKAIMVPCFGKLYGQIRLHTPIYTVKTSAEFQNATQNRMTPLFTGFFHSQGTAPNFEFLNYKLDTSTRIAVPKMKRIVFAETVKFDHVALGAEHQASVTLYGLSAQAQAKTTFKVDTEYYTANLMNTAFIAVEGGMTATVDTTYTHTMQVPLVEVPKVVSVNQKIIAQQDGFTLKLTADNSANGKCSDINFQCYGINHVSSLQLSLTPRIGSLLFSGDTDLADIKMKQHITAESGTFSYFKFNVSNKAEAPIIKNSLLVASGLASINDMKIEIKANHETELQSAESGVSSNVVNFKICPAEFVFEFQNRATAKINIFKDLFAKLELQNDYLVNLGPDGQKINRFFLARLNEYKTFFNVTLSNNRNEAGIFFETETHADLFFLNVPVSIPEIELPFVDFHTPAFSDLNLYEQTGLQNILTTTEQILSVDAKVLYQKSKAAPLVDIMGLIHIPSMDRLTTDLSFRSAIFDLNANALLYAEDGLFIRVGANTVSVFDYLVAKLEGTTILTTKKGIKLASTISLKNQHIEGTYASTISMSTETFETAVSVASVGKITLPILNLEANQNLIANSKPRANAQSTFQIKGDFNISKINAIGMVEADHTLKLEVNHEHVSLESAVKSNMNGRVFENYLILGVLDNEAHFYLSENSFRSTSKVTADAKLNHGATKVIGMDVNNNMAAEASLGRLFAELRHSCNNEANLFDFKTKGKHNIQATIDLAPISSLTAGFEIDMAQQCNHGDLTYFEKIGAEVTTSKQKIASVVKFVSPVYITNMEAEMEGSAPVFKVKFKSSATSPIVMLQYDLDAHSTTNFENDLVKMVSKLALTHTDLTMDVNHAIIQALRQKRQADEGVPHQTLNVDITSPTFTAVNLRYASHRDAISASVSTPTAGFLGLQLNPVQMSARFYGRSPTALDTDVELLQVRPSKDADKTNLQIIYNIEAQKAIVSELKTRLPAIISSFKVFADKYHITSFVELLKECINNHINEAYNVAVNYDVQMSQISIFFRNTVVRYQKAVKTFLDAVIKVLRETHFSLPGSDEMITLPELQKRLITSTANMLGVTVQNIHENMDLYCNYFVEKIGNIEVAEYDGEVITGSQIINEVKTEVKDIFDDVVDLLKNLENLDAMLEEISDTLEVFVEETQEFVDSLKSDYLDEVFTDVNEIYRKVVTAVRNFADEIPPFSMEELSRVCESIMNTIIQLIDQFSDEVFSYLQQTSEEVQASMTVRDGMLEITLPLEFQH